MAVALSQFAQTLSVETAFTVLAVAKQLQATGKDVVELEIGDSPFDSTASAKSAKAAPAKTSSRSPSISLRTA